MTQKTKAELVADLRKTAARLIREYHGQDAVVSLAATDAARDLAGIADAIDFAAAAVRASR